MKTSSKEQSLTEKGSRNSVVFSGISCILFAVYFLASVQSFGTVYYSRTNGGNWNVNATWSTVGYGNATNTGTYPKAGDVANIGDLYTINITSSVACATLNIGQGTSGVLQYGSASNYVLTVSGNLTVNTGAKLWYNIATTRTHNCYVSGDFVNYGTVDFYYGSGMVVNLRFNGSTNSIVTGNGTWDLNTVTLSKVVSRTYYVDVLTNNFEAGIKTLTLSYGTYIHDNAGTFDVNPVATGFTLGPNVIMIIPQGTMIMGSSANLFLLQGELYVNGGNAIVGTTAGTNGIKTDQNGPNIPYLEITSGSLTVYGGISYQPAASAEPFGFKMTGGTLNLNTGSTGTSREVFYVNDVAGSSFYMSGGTIVLEKKTKAGTNITDFSVCGTNGTVTTTGGTVQFGNGNTPSGTIFNFRPYASAVYPHFNVTGLAGNDITLKTSISSTANFKLLSLTIDVNKTFDIRSIVGAFGDNKQMTLLSAASGTDALINNGTFVARQSTVTFNTSGAQAIGGANVTTFYNLSINNISGITLHVAADVSNYLSMVLGNLNTTNSNIITCLANADANLGASTSFVDGPMVNVIATSSSTTRTWPIGKSTSHRPVVLTVKHSDATSVSYRSEIFNSPASALPYTLPPTITNVSSIRYTRFLRQAVNNFVNGTIRMYYGPDDQVLDYPNLRIVHDNGVSQWVDIGGTATANFTGNIVSASFNFFNTYFALANPPGGNNPLPVSLVSFNANLNQNKVNVDWVTESEINNDHFDVQRSTDNIEFTTIATIAGKGNSTSALSYSMTDDDPFTGTSYYRLVQVDFDGKTTIYRPVSINNKVKGNFEVFPSVTNGDNIHLRYNGGDLSSYQIIVQNAEGKIIPATFRKVNGGIDMQISNGNGDHSNIFFVRATNETESLVNKFILIKD